MDAERFLIYLAEVETGILLDERGGHGTQHNPALRRRFATQLEALEAKDELLRRFPFAEVWIQDLASEEEAERYVDEAGFKVYATAMAAWRKWLYGSKHYRLMTPEPPNPRIVPAIEPDKS